MLTPNLETHTSHQLNNVVPCTIKPLSAPHNLICSITRAYFKAVYQKLLLIQILNTTTI